jgi:hypothetical protein
MRDLGGGKEWEWEADSRETQPHNAGITHAARAQRPGEATSERHGSYEAAKDVVRSTNVFHALHVPRYMDAFVQSQRVDRPAIVSSKEWTRRGCEQSEPIASVTPLDG